MYKLMSGAGVHCGRRKNERPVHGVMKALHHMRSRSNPRVRSTVFVGCCAVVLRSMSRCRKVCPAGTIFAAKPSDPMSDSSSRLEHCERCDHEVSADLRSVTLSSGSRAFKDTVSSRIPRYSSCVVGPSSARGQWSELQREVKVLRCT